MLQITGLNRLGEDAAEADDVNIDYPETLSLNLLGNSIGAKKARVSHNFGAAK